MNKWEQCGSSNVKNQEVETLLERDPGSGFRKTKHERAEHEVITNKKLCYVYNSVQRVYYLPFYFEEEADLT